MVRIDTSCSDCIFAKTLSNKQVGCMHGFLEYFDETGGEVLLTEDGLSHILVNKVCPFRRYIDWMPDSYEEALCKVKEEVLPRLNIILFHSSSVEALHSTLESLSSINHLDKMELVVVYNTKNRDEIQKVVSSYFKKARYCSLIEDVDPFTEGFKSTKNGYVLRINSGYNINPNVIDIINYAINYQQKTVLYIKPDQDDNMELVMSILAKHLKLGLLFSIEDKILSLIEAQNIQKQVIFTWKELEDAYWLSLNRN